jgi:hypothetical protein
MTGAYTERGEEFGYLCVDVYLADFVAARALTSALETGLVDDLLQHQPCAPIDLAVRRGMDARALHLLLGMLRANGVVEHDTVSVKLSAPFMVALRYRDLLESKLYFANLVAPDFLDLFTVLLTSPAHFAEKARVFDFRTAAVSSPARRTTSSPRAGCASPRPSPNTRRRCA